MRYQVHRLQQEALIELGLNTEDALLLDWMLNWKDGNSMERIVVGNDVAYWVNYSKVIEELPILFKKTKGFASVEEEEKAKKANATKVARMLKGNLSKVLTRHEKKVQGKTKVYISFNRDMIDYLVNNENKKASTVPPVKAEDLKNNDFNNIIPQNNSNDTKKEEDLEIINLIKESCINVRKADLIKYKDEFADINRFKEAIAICESRNSHGIKALRLAYKYGDNDNKKDNKKQSTIFMADSQVDINGKLKSVTEMTDKEIEEKINQKWGWTF